MMKEMTAAKVLSLLQIYSEIEAQVWLAGGWAVDALVGKQTRKHKDIDLPFDTRDETKILNILGSTRPMQY